MERLTGQQKEEKLIKKMAGIYNILPRLKVSNWPMGRQNPGSCASGDCIFACPNCNFIQIWQATCRSPDSWNCCLYNLLMTLVVQILPSDAQYRNRVWTKQEFDQLQVILQQLYPYCMKLNTVRKDPLTPPLTHKYSPARPSQISAGLKLPLFCPKFTARLFRPWKACQ